MTMRSGEQWRAFYTPAVSVRLNCLSSRAVRLPQVLGTGSLISYATRVSFMFLCTHGFSDTATPRTPIDVGRLRLICVLWLRTQIPRVADNGSDCGSGANSSRAIMEKNRFAIRLSWRNNGRVRFAGFRISGWLLQASRSEIIVDVSI